MRVKMSENQGKTIPYIPTLGKLAAEAAGIKEVKKKKYKPAQYIPPPGYERNPMLRYPKNYPCFCDSKKKFKKCCLRKLKNVIPKKDFVYYNKKIEEYLKQVAEYERRVPKKDRRLKEGKPFEYKADVFHKDREG